MESHPAVLPSCHQHRAPHAAIRIWLTYPRSAAAASGKPRARRWRRASPPYSTTGERKDRVRSHDVRPSASTALRAAPGVASTRYLTRLSRTAEVVSSCAVLGGFAKEHGISLVGRNAPDAAGMKAASANADGAAA